MDRDGFLWESVSLETVQCMDWRDFEHVVGDLWEEMGYTTEVRDGNNDYKVDVIARKRGPGGKTVAIQAKRHNERNTINRTKVQEYYGIHTQIDADECYIVTTGDFSSDALAIADQLGVRTMGGEELLLTMERHASLTFFLEHAEALGINKTELHEELQVRGQRSPVERTKLWLRSIAGRSSLLLGHASQSLGRAGIRWQWTYRRTAARVRGYDPAIYAERNGDGAEWFGIDERNSDKDEVDDDRDWHKIASRLTEHGRNFQERGISLMHPSTITWNPGGRALLPSTGVNPKFRRDDWFSLPRQSALVVIASLCCLVVAVAAVTSVEVAPGSYPLATVLVVASLVATTGVLLPSLTLSRSPVDITRAAYSVPSAAPVGLWLVAGYPGIQDWLYPLTGAVILSSGCFLGQTWLFQNRNADPPTFAPAGIHQPYCASYNPITILGLIGVIFLWVAVGLSPLIDTDAAVRWSGVQNTLAVVSLLAIVVACLGYAWRGGIIGVSASVIAVGGVVALASTRAGSLFDGSVHTGSYLVGTLVILLAATYVLFRTKHRIVDRWHVVTGGLVLLLVLEATGYWPIVILLDAYGSVGIWTLVTVNTVVATVLFTTVLTLERRAIRETLEE